MSNKKLIISGSRMELKNPLDAPESILLRGLHKKIEPIRPRGLGCRGGAIDFGPTTSYNSRTSVYVRRQVPEPPRLCRKQKHKK